MDTNEKDALIRISGEHIRICEILLGLAGRAEKKGMFGVDGYRYLVEDSRREVLRIKEKLNGK